MGGRVTIVRKLGPFSRRLAGLFGSKVSRVQGTYSYNLGCPPSQDSSHHQDDITFLVGDPNLNLHLPQLLGGGTTQVITYNPTNHPAWKTHHFCHPKNIAAAIRKPSSTILGPSSLSKTYIPHVQKPMSPPDRFFLLPSLERTKLVDVFFC